MDYKYIEQLTERYFQCETSLQEEQILRAFYSQDEASVPEQLRQYMPLFAALKADDTLGDDFDQRILGLIDADQPQSAKARVMTIHDHLRPLLRAAAIVAVVFTIGTVADRSLRLGTETQQSDDINYAAYKDTYSDPTMAYDKVEDALMLLSDGFSHTMMADSALIDSLTR